jgi:predicted dehydrogenase
MELLRVGVIGVGFIGRWHIENLRRLNGIEVTALSNSSQEASEKRAKEWAVPKVYGNWKDLIADPLIEVVHICAPNKFHFEMAKAALNAGKHVLCEKPLTMEIGQAQELVRLAAEKKRANGVHFNIRFYPLVHQIREMIRYGDLGTLLTISGTYLQDLLVKDTDYNWRMNSEYDGYSRVVSDIGSHWFDAVEFMTGLQIEELCADFATVHKTRKKPLKAIETYSSTVVDTGEYQEVVIKSEDYASILLRFRGGAHGCMTICQTAPGRKNRAYFEFSGSKASAAFNSERPNELWVGRRDGNNEIIMKDPSLLYPEAREITNLPGGHNEAFPDTSKQLFKNYYQYIRERGHETEKFPVFPTFKDGLRETFLTDAAMQSARQNQWVSVKD